MLPRSISQLFATLSTAKGASIAGPAAIALVGLLTIGRSAEAPAATPGLGPAPQALAAAEPSPATIETAGDAGFSPAQTKAIQQIVKDYLIQNPEVMVEVSKELEKRQQALQAAEHKRLIVQHKAQIFAAPGDFVYGNPKGDITVVEFFDYNCGWCKKAVDDLVKLAKADPKVRIVMKEFPIFGENSAYAARAAMASIKQGKYWDLHVAMMREKQVTKDNVLKIAEKVGINVAKLKADMEDPAFDAALKATQQIAQALSIEGTPGFIVDNKVNVGYLPIDGLQQLVGEVRKAGCQVC